MARQPINHGTVAGDGTGETLFDAFQKVNANETELYAAKTEVVANEAALPVSGETTKLYVAYDTGVTYKWTGTAYQAITLAPAYDGSGNVTGLVGADGTNVLDFDPVSGNIVAQVNLRTGVLGDSASGLLALAGGAGEIAVATTPDALVRYTGVLGEARAYYRSGLIGNYIALLGNAVNVATGATGAAAGLGVTATLDSLSAKQSDNTTLLVPASTGRLATLVAEGVAWFGSDFSDNGVGTVRSLQMQYDANGAGNWQDVGDAVSGTPAAFLTAFNFRLLGDAFQSAVVAQTCKFRILAKQDSGITLPVTLKNLVVNIYRN